MGFTVTCLLIKCLKPDVEVEVSIAYKKADVDSIILKPC